MNKNTYTAIDFFASPLTFLASTLLHFIRKRGIDNFPIAKKIFLSVGVFPIADHYYEPLFHEKHLRYPLSNDRILPGINWNLEEQLNLLKCFNYNDELIQFPENQGSQLGFYYRNPSYGTGDSEFLYNMIRYFKPHKLVEIGSGISTLMAQNAIKKNATDDPEYFCEHICIEPFEAPWLEDTGVNIIRRKVEEIEKDIFTQLNKNDILFIDSSHMIRPQGDVLYEYLELLPILKAGVIIHIHDIFSPKDYLRDWVIKNVQFWNEQYLLEGFLSFNSSFKIIAALNYLHHNYFNELSAKCPMLTRDREPGAFYIQKTG
jgi:hypothetical protein